jgi:hypothetical protein
VEKFIAQGLDVISDADTYLTLIMKALAEGEIIDENTFTVINGKSLTETTRVAGGVYFNNQVRLLSLIPDGKFGRLRVRGLVKVM